MARKIVALKDKNNNELFLLIFPIGSIYMSVNPTNPKEFFGGKWELWGKGRTPVCIDPNQDEFKEVEQLGGEKEHKLTKAEMPYHDHSLRWQYEGGTGSGHGTLLKNSSDTAQYSYNTGGTGGDQPHNNLQPYITCYMWKRIA